MIDIESLRSLASSRSTDGAFVSAFFSTSRLDDWRQTAPTFLNSESNNLVRERGFSREEAYIICSVAVDLKISEIVDAPNWIVSAFLPDSIFG